MSTSNFMQYFCVDNKIDNKYIDNKRRQPFINTVTTSGWYGFNHHFLYSGSAFCRHTYSIISSALPGVHNKRLLWTPGLTDAIMGLEKFNYTVVLAF